MSFVASVLPFERSPDYRSMERSYVHRNRGFAGGFFDDIGDFVSDGITGLTEALGHALEEIGQAVGKLGETIALIVRASIGDVSWDAVLDEMGAMFQDIGAALVYLDPARMTNEWLSTSDLTSHAFKELDKFTGGMITTATNVSTLVGRAMRGDAISKQELLADVVFIIQVCMIIFTGGAWVAVGIMIGTMVGKEVCKHQTEARDACLVAFQIIGAAAGGWGQALYSSGFSAAEEAAWLEGDEAYAEFLRNQASQGVLSEAEQNAWLQGDDAYANYLQQEAAATTAASSTSFLTHLSQASEQYLNRVGIDQASQQMVQLCQQSHMVGRNECQVLGEIAADYLKSPPGQEWTDFLASEIAKIGAEQIMLQWFPPDSPEHRAIQRAWEIKYVDVPVDETRVVQKKLDPKAVLLVAGAIAFAMVGGS